MANIDRESYSVLRYGGASQRRACAELGVSFGRSEFLEMRLQRRRGAGSDAMRPSFARHAAHVAAVMAEGGYPVLR